MIRFLLGLFVGIIVAKLWGRHDVYAVAEYWQDAYYRARDEITAKDRDHLVELAAIARHEPRQEYLQ